MAIFPAARYTDLCTGHGCYPPRPNAEGSPTVSIDDLALHRKTDSWYPHCCGLACHGAITVEGSQSVYCDDLPAARVMDGVLCSASIDTNLDGIPESFTFNSVIMTGSPEVFIGD